MTLNLCLRILLSITNLNNKFNIMSQLDNEALDKTNEELSKMTAAKLKEIAHEQESDELKGVANLHKEKLLPLLCKVLGVEIPHHHVEGIDKGKIKKQIRELKKKRDEILAEKKGKEELKKVRHEIHNLKKELRRHMV